MTTLLAPEELIKKLRQTECNGFPLVDKELKFGCEFTFEHGRAEKIRDLAVLTRYHEYMPENAPESCRMYVYSFFNKRENGNQEFCPDKDELEKRFKVEILGTPPSMQRVMAFLHRKFTREHSNEQRHQIAIITLVQQFITIDPTGSHDFFWLIENAGEHYEEIEKFCNDYIL